MDVENLVKMANAVAQFYASGEDRDAAVDGVTSHLRRYWDPRMRRELVAYVTGGGAQAAPMVVAAAYRLAPECGAPV